MENTTMSGKDLTKEAPRSALARNGGFAIIERTIDKCRAKLWGNIGEYHFDCPVDKMLFNFKGITGDDFKAYVEEGHTDEEIVQWVKDNGTPKTDEEIQQWSDTVDPMYSKNEDAQKVAWFAGECARLNIDPETTSLFTMLDVDDKALFNN